VVVSAADRARGRQRRAATDHKKGGECDGMSAHLVGEYARHHPAIR
jgi:hypothetical protein